MSFQPFDLDVEELDPPHDRGGLARACSRCWPAVWWTIANLTSERVARRAAADRLVRAPRRARDDRRRDRRSRHPERHVVARAPDEVRADARDVADGTRLDPVGGARPPRVAEPPAAASLLRASPTSGPSSSSGAAWRHALQRPPRERVRNSTVPGAAPRDSCEREPRHRSSGDVAAAAHSAGASTVVACVALEPNALGADEQRRRAGRG